MNQSWKIAALCAIVVLIALPALAQAQPTNPEDATPATEKEVAAKGPERSLIYLGSTFGVAMVIIGASYSISKIGACAVESMARQPEVAGSIQMAMVISAALIEGATFFALIVCWQVA